MLKKNSILVVLMMTAFLVGCQPNERTDPGADKPELSDDRQLDTTHRIDEIPTDERPAPDSDDNNEIPLEPNIESEVDTPDNTETEPAAKIEPVVEIIEPKPEPETDDAAPPDKDAAARGDSKVDEKPEVDKPAKAKEAEFYEHCRHIFTTYVDKNGNVDYKKLRRKRVELIRAARSFEEIDAKEAFFWKREEKIALWINAFNIFTLKTVIDNYPIQGRWYMINYPADSIIQIQGAWTKNYFKVMGIEYTLREIERGQLLQKFKDMRICFALTYATRGGAFLRNEPYYPEKLEQQLDEQVRKFLKSPRGMKIGEADKAIWLSDIFNWYRGEFTGKYGDMKRFRERPERTKAYLNFAADYVSTEDVRHFDSADYTVKFMKYDWNLNEQTGK